MSDAFSDSARSNRARQRRAELRSRYLDTLRDYLAAPSTEAQQRTLTAYAVCMGIEEGVSEGVAIKFGMMLAGLRKAEEKAWAKCLTAHVGFSDPIRLAEFKALSPFKDMIIIQREDYLDGHISMCGEAKEFLRTLETELVIASRHYAISDINKIKRSFVALILSESARNRPSI